MIEGAELLLVDGLQQLGNAAGEHLAADEAGVRVRGCLAGQVLAVRACAGVATVDEAPSPLPGPSDLLQRADVQMYRNKRRRQAIRPEAEG